MSWDTRPPSQQDSKWCIFGKGAEEVRAGLPGGLVEGSIQCQSFPPKWYKELNAAGKKTNFMSVCSQYGKHGNLALQLSNSFKISWHFLSNMFPLQWTHKNIDWGE